MTALTFSPRVTTVIPATTAFEVRRRSILMPRGSGYLSYYRHLVPVWPRYR